jgi:hypothetical protein
VVYLRVPDADVEKWRSEAEMQIDEAAKAKLIKDEVAVSAADLGEQADAET